MEFKVFLIGVGSASPAHGRHLSSQLVYLRDRIFMIDCGEGTQFQVSHYKVKKNKIGHILISHFHGDHIYGLPGFLGSLSLSGRRNKLTIYAPEGLKKYLEYTFVLSESHLTYPLEIIELSSDTLNKIELGDGTTISAFPLSHRVPTLGYRIDFRPMRYNLNKSKIMKYDLSNEQLKKLTMGESVQVGSEKILASEMTYPLSSMKSYAYCSDTAVNTSYFPYIKNVDMLYHETTYLDELSTLAGDRGHSTLGQAMGVAKDVGARTLLTGHYSSRYRDLAGFKMAAKDSDIPVIIGEEGQFYDI